MKKKTITLALAVVMCLSVITSATASEPLKRVASKIPGTDIDYNYVENVTVKIPGTDVTYELTGVYEKVGVVYQDCTILGDIGTETEFPVYRFAFLENGGEVKIKQVGEYLTGKIAHGDFGGAGGEAGSDEYKANEVFTYSFSYPQNRSIVRQTRDAVGVSNPKDSIKVCTTYIFDDGSCKYHYDEDDICLAKVEFYFGYGRKCANGFESPYDLISFKYGSYWDTIKECYCNDNVPADIEKIDISLLDINYKAPINYNIIDGANSVVTSNSLTVRADGEFSKFTGVKVDGKPVDSSNYTATEGSTIIEFKADYLKTLDAGKHTVSIVFTDGEAVTDFEIKNADTSNTGNNTGSDNLVTDVEIPNTDYNTSVSAAFVAMIFSGAVLLGLKKKSN